MGGVERFAVFDTLINNSSSLLKKCDRKKFGLLTPRIPSLLIITANFSREMFLRRNVAEMKIYMYFCCFYVHNVLNEIIVRKQQ